MRFINLAGALQVARRFVTGTSKEDINMNDQDVLADVIRQLTKRVSELEAKVGPDPVEFEKDVGTLGARISLEHNFSCPIRWYVTSWVGNAGSGPNLRMDAANSNINRLVLQSYTSGRAVIRIEPSQYQLTA